MFWTDPLSTIRSFPLYTQQWYMSYRFADSLQRVNLYDIYLLLCVQWKAPDDGQRNCPKHVEFYSKNKFEKLVHLVGFIIRIYHNAWSPERQIWFMVNKVALWQVYLLVLQFTSVSFIPPVLHTHPINQPSITTVTKPHQPTASLYNKPKIKAKSQVLIKTHTHLSSQRRVGKFCSLLRGLQWLLLTEKFQ